MCKCCWCWQEVSYMWRAAWDKAVVFSDSKQVADRGWYLILKGSRIWQKDKGGFSVQDGKLCFKHSEICITTYWLGNVRGNDKEEEGRRSRIPSVNSKHDLLSQKNSWLIWFCICRQASGQLPLQWTLGGWERVWGKAEAHRDCLFIHWAHSARAWLWKSLVCCLCR